MLEMRPNCECCDGNLPPDREGAVICTFECTFCVSCAQDRLGGRCPNCGGTLQPRPARPAGLLAQFPGGQTRVLRTDRCAQSL